MAAYAAVVSVMNTMDAVMNDPRLSPCFDEKQIQSLGEKLGVLLQFIENYNSLGRDEQVESLERRISSAAHAAEDVIEKHIVDQIQAGVLEKKAPTLSIDLNQIIQDIDLVKEEVEKRGTNDEHTKYSTSAAAASSESPLLTELNTVGKTTMVGFDDYLLQLLEGLTGNNSNKTGRLVIPVVGMGGAGKTTLTRNAYENPLTVHHFDVRAWVSISQQYDVKNILMQLLSNIGQSSEGNNEGELSERLYKYLSGRRYLIVLDDMWSIKAWDEIKFSFPDNCSGSRIIVSTRLMEVANELGSSRVVRMDMLNDDKSWKLFCLKAFPQHEGCPAELKEIGKRIVKKCKGLPLSIVVIGALLGTSSQTKDLWETTVENMDFFMSLTDDILCLSYIHLPAHLKPCFLYLGIFREDQEIHVSQVIKLWVSEGFIKPNKDQRLEEVAEGYINDLFERSLILAGSVGWNGKLETFLVHDVVRELCLSEAKKEKFLCFMGLVEGFVREPADLDSERRIVVTGGALMQKFGDGISLTFGNSLLARSLICEWDRGPSFQGSTLLRLLAVGNSDVTSFEQVNMRLLANNIHSTNCGWRVHELPRSIFLLWNLQTLIFIKTGLDSEAPVEIWKLPQLRHVEFDSIRLPEPPPMSDEEFVLHNLHTLMTVENWRCDEEVCKRIPNIKRLGLRYRLDYVEEDFSETTYDSIQNVWRLNKLESLSYFFQTSPYRHHLLQNLVLPGSLKELTLDGEWMLKWDDDMMRRIGTLPNLQFLKLLGNSFVGGEWNCVEGEFLHLKYMFIGCVGLEKWNAESSHFPVLETLVLQHLSELKEIPSGIGDIPTLTCIRLDRCDHTYQCNVSNKLSAMKILEEQESLGNDGLQVQLVFWHKGHLKELAKVVDGISCSNFKLYMRFLFDEKDRVLY